MSAVEDTRKELQYKASAAIREATNVASPDLHEIKKDLSSLKEHTVALGHSLGEVGSQKAHEAGDYLQKQAAELRVSGNEALSRLETQIKAKPTQSILLAFLAGGVASMIFGRR